MTCIEAINREAKSYERFISRISVAVSGCWEMNASHDRDGYAQFHKSKNLYKAHRISYEWHKGKIPAGLTIDHLCENKGCVNPEHLEAVTREENGSRHNAKGYKKWWVALSDDDKAAFVENVSKKASQVAATKKLAATHCRRGHEWKLETTYITPGSGHRRCEVCFAEVQKRANAKRMAKKNNNIK
jgi:hypothetical protein